MKENINEICQNGFLSWGEISGQYLDIYNHIIDFSKKVNFL